MNNVHSIQEKRRDILFETLAEVCGIDIAELTKSARGSLNKACQELREINPPPDEIHRRAERFTEKFPGCTMTPTALAKHWPMLKGGRREVVY